MTQRTSDGTTIPTGNGSSSLKGANPPTLVGATDTLMDSAGSAVTSAPTFSTASSTGLDPVRVTFGAVILAGSSDSVRNPVVEPFLPTLVAHELIDATNAINAKAAALGGAGVPLADVEAAGAGFVGRFVNADIYFSPATGTHEVHGAIRDKYNALGGAAGPLGLPLTDETGTPDGIGRFNHFQGGSIYWTGRTGAVMVRESIRHLWATQGWETGPLGYPVQDEHRYVTPHPATDPFTAWSVFENGAIVAGAAGTAVARTVEIAPDKLRCLVRQEFDRVMHESPDNVGLHAPSEITAVSRNYPRAVTFVIHGFHDNGLASDTDFDITVGLRFGLTWEAGLFTEPLVKNLAAALVSLSVSATGPSPTVGPGARGVRDGVSNAFATPRPVGPPIPAANALAPNTPDLIDVLVTAEGGLRVLLNPLPNFASGGIRVIAAQAAVDQLGC